MRTSDLVDWCQRPETYRWFPERDRPPIQEALEQAVTFCLKGLGSHEFEVFAFELLKGRNAESPSAVLVSDNVLIQVSPRTVIKHTLSDFDRLEVSFDRDGHVAALSINRHRAGVSNVPMFEWTSTKPNDFESLENLAYSLSRNRGER